MQPADICVFRGLAAEIAGLKGLRGVGSSFMT